AGTTIVLPAVMKGIPVPTAKWLSDGNELKTEGKFKVETEGTSTVLSISECARTDGGEYILTVANPAGSKSVALHVTVLDLPVLAKDILVPPEVTVDVACRDLVTVRAGQIISLVTRVKGRPDPEITWTKDARALGRDKRMEMNNNYPLCELVIQEAVRADYGKYAIQAKNSSGQAQATIIVNVLDIPGACQNLKVAYVTKDCCMVSWENPEDNGGTEITNYKIECRQPSQRGWTLVSSDCTKRLIKAPLLENCEYFFRVSAENKIGLGPATESKAPVLAVDPVEKPGEPENFHISEIGKTFVFLKWKKPEYDGGSRNLAYHVEKKPKEADEWERVHKGAIKETYFMADRCIENQIYQFRVQTKNEGGESNWVTTGEVLVKEELVIPEVKVKLEAVLVVKSGDSIPIEAEVKGKPQPEVKWSKEGAKEDVIRSPRLQVESGVNFSKFLLTNARRTDTGKYIITATNAAGSSSAEAKVNVLDRPGPVRDLKVSGISVDRCKLKCETKRGFSWETPENDGGVPINNYVIEIRETTSQSWVELSSLIIRTTYKATRLTTGVEYQFRVKAKNRYGVGPPITSEPVVAAYPFKAPGPPGTPKVVAFTKDTMTVGWNEPVNDGGSEVIGYHLERKERNSIVWHRISKTLVVGNLFKTTGLEPGSAYEFRVMAENIAGVGKPSKASEPMLALDPVDPPGQPVPIHISKNAITIQWTKPEYDGGFKITGYIVEKRDLPAGRWIRANFTNIIETTFTVSGLTKDESYEFRVFARNSAGALSNPSEQSDPITCKDDIIEPRIMVDAKFKDVLLVRAGESFKLDADVAGQPLPSMVWTKDGKDVENTSKLQIKMSDTNSGLVNKDSLRKDGGEFVLTATNVGGFAKHIFNVKVLDRPGPPGGPLKVSDVTAEKCVLTWAPPADDGGANIEYYVVEKRESSRLAWTTVERDLHVTQYQVTKLLKGNEYIFRVMAVNKYGVGEALESDPTIADNPYVPPDPPQTPEITAVTKDSIVVCWGAPAHNGGSEITNYGIERRDRLSLRWVKCNKKKVTDLHFKVTGLVPGHEYEFRVFAENAAGISAPSGSSPFTKASDALFKPGPPGNPRILDTTSSSITLAWNRPLYDGGSEVTGYIVETCLPGTEEEEWKIVTPKEGLKGTSFTITNLKENQEYKINVSAMNSEGVGEAAAVPGTPKAEERLINTSSFTSLVIGNVNRFDSGKYNLTVENSSGSKTVSVTVRVLDTPGAPQNLKISQVTKESVTLIWEPPINDGGTKIKNYVVEKREATRKAYATVNALCHKTTWTIDQLQEGCNYYFRVLAENEYGIGLPIETGESVKVSEKPLPPRKVILQDVTKTSVTLSWEKPEHDGGSRVVAYVVEIQPKGSDKWSQSVIVKVPEAVISGLNTGEEYMFRVSARNEKGTSDPRQIGVPVIVKDLVIAPSAKLLFSTYTVLAEKDLTIDIPYIARPKAAVSWVKDGAPLKRTSRVNFSSTDTLLSLVIKEATRDDVGKYSIKLSNTAGETTVDIGVVVLDKPGPPSGPVKVEEVTSDSVTISWNPPEYDGGCTINNYLVEKRDTSTTAWAVVATNLARTKVKAGRLKTGTEYQFRISAENRYGKSPLLVSECVVAQYPYKIPGPPGTPFVQFSTKDSMVVVWNEPVIDGGSTILGYHLERKERNSILWVKLNKTIIQDTTYKTTGLEAGLEYEFRVYAENIVGIGRASKLSEGYIARDPCDPPGTPEAVKITKNSITIAWTKPEYDGGSKVTGYIVEKKELPEGRWLKANFTNVIETEYNATGLAEDQKYEFRVIARNAAGVFSIPSYSTGPITAKDEIEPPRISIDPQYTQTIVVNAGDNFKIDADVHGKPVPTIHWMKDAPEFDMKNFPHNTVYVRAGSNLKFELPLFGKPMPKVAMTRNNTPVKCGKRFSFEVTPESLNISLKESISSDAGRYDIVASNTGGTTKMFINILVLDRPGPPSGPVEVSDIGETSLTLKWLPPVYDGGSPVTNYVVVRRETSTPAWVEVSSTIARSIIKVTKLTKGEEYQFRIKAENRFGISDYIDSQTITVKLPYSEYLQFI
uniref:Titin n=1 Tax=Astyanax mexicanus TaxID=7994 RepID=A0A8B9HA48_ASTMX